MEKYREIPVTKIIYEFYCDKCGELIGESEEYDDGYHEELGKYTYRIRVNNKASYYKSAHLCEKCRKETDEELNSKVKKFITELGFNTTREDYIREGGSDDIQ